MLLWVAASLLLAALIVPWLYQGGRCFAELAGAQARGGVLGWLIHACQRAAFGRYFNRSLLLAALVLLPVLLQRLRWLRRRETPAPAAAPCPGESWPQGLRQLALGLVVAGGGVWALGVVMTQVGTFAANPVQPTLAEWFSKVVVAAAAVSVLEECMFRGLLLGLWLRVSRPVAAAVGTSLVFAFMHFLSPPAEYGIDNPTSPLAGLRWLGGILRHFTEPGFVVADFLTIFGVGLVLAWARLRTGRLWLPIGLHCGWVIAFKGHNLTHVKLTAGPVASWLIGDSLRSGLLPLATVGLTALICHLLLGQASLRR